MGRQLKEILASLPQERQDKIQLRANEIRAEEASLKAIRKLLGFNQKQVAALLGLQQPALSKLENQDNLGIGRLREIIEAMGGEMDVVIRMPDREPLVLKRPRL